MANIIDIITIGAVQYLTIDSDPTISTGVSAPLGSIATISNGNGIYLKYGSVATNWNLLIENNASPTFTNVTITGTLQDTSFAGTGSRMVESDSTGNITATESIVSAYITSSTTQTLLSTTSNWDINGSYIGTTITGTYQGQKWYDSNYFYEAIADNNFIRLIRG